MRLNLDRNAALLIAVSLVRGFGGMVLMTLSGIWVMSLTGSASLAALAGMCLYVPAVLGPVLGAAADRLPPRALLIWVNVLLAGALMVLLLVHDAAGTWLIFAVMTGYGLSSVLVGAAESVLLPSVLASVLLGQVNGTRVSVQEGMKLVAPLLAAGLFTWQGGHPVVLVAAVALGTASLIYAQLPRVAVGAAEHAGNGLVRQGVQYLWADPVLRPVVLAAGGCVALSGFSSAATFAMIAEGLGKPAAFMGVLGATQGAGAIAGGLAGGWVLNRFGERWLAGAGAFLFAAGTLTRCFPVVPMAIAGSVLIGVGLPLTLVASVTAVQSRTPSDLLGRVAGTATTLVFTPVAVAIPIGSALLIGLNYQVIFVLTLLAGFAVAAYMFLAGNRGIMTG